MPEPILATKLFVPPPVPGAVARPRLTERLDAGLYRKLTLVSAPAGFGKTTLVGEWSTGSARPVAWLSLDERDGDLIRFFSYLIAAIQSINPGLGRAAQGLLQTTPPPSHEVVLTVLLNEISESLDRFVLVLDDYHQIASVPVDDALTFLIDHLPQQMHLVIITRHDPGIPIARMRARGHVTELRVADLRFTSDEASEFLQRMTGLDLPPGEVATLESRTEGWIAALHLAALSMNGRGDVGGFIQAFRGDDRHITDYLVQEVLDRLPERDRDFLLQTSILERLTGSLCDAVTGQSEGRERLIALERNNVFVVPLDDKRQWYRYHHLFAELLTVRLMAAHSEHVSELHRRASSWYEQHGNTESAIDHAFSAMDYDRAGDLVERALPGIRQRRQESSLLAWLDSTPENVLEVRPVLAGGYAWALLSGGHLERAEEWLRSAERWLKSSPHVDATGVGDLEQIVSVNPEELARLPTAISVYRAVISQIRGDAAAAIRYSEDALSQSNDGDPLARGSATAILGLASWASGDLETANRAFSSGLESVRAAGNVSDAIAGGLALGEIRVALGRLSEAKRAYEDAFRFAAEQETSVQRGVADIYLGMSELHYEFDDLGAARQYLTLSDEAGHLIGMPQNRSRWFVAMARIQQASGDFERALELLHEADRLHVPDFSPDVRPVGARIARVKLAQGNILEALQWLRDRNLAVHDELDYLREFEYITLARILIAQYALESRESAIDDAIRLLERLLSAAVDGGRTGSELEILIVQALALQAYGDTTAAMNPLRRAIELAEREGYVRLFVEEGRPMERLLKRAAQEAIAPDYVRRLLTGFGVGADRLPQLSGLIEPLSRRELDVLRLLETDLGGPGIADELLVSLNTLRTHTRRIYSKLGVTSRRAAVRRARELGLLA